jgi:FKBP-type peptidyl-prolyl cis-trans isomerase 2
VIIPGTKVKFEYELTIDGKVIDSSASREPLEYIHGEGGIIAGLERQLEGLAVGDERTIQVKASEAYGEVSPEGFREVNKTNLPQDKEMKPGMMLEAATDNGQGFPVTIMEVKEETVVLNFNHPLAGQDLTFKVKIISAE